MTRSHMNFFGYSQPIDFIVKMENLADAYVSYLQHASKPPIEPTIKRLSSPSTSKSSSFDPFLLINEPLSAAASSIALAQGSTR